jgi:hypothetical protein
VPSKPSLAIFTASVQHRLMHIFFASASREPVVYEVEPEGQLASDPECRSGVSFTCRKAKIIAIHKISGKSIKKAQGVDSWIAPARVRQDRNQASDPALGSWGCGDFGNAIFGAFIRPIPLRPHNFRL